MGRRKDNPLLQAAKGFPSRRKGKVLKEIEIVAGEADRDKSGDPFALPAIFLNAPVYWKRAIDLWEQQSDVLRVSGRRRPGYRGALTRYCIWMLYYEVAADTLRKDNPRGGLTIKWQMAHGETKIMPHPSLAIMKDAEGVLRLLEAEFGFSPRADSDLTRVESFNAAQGRLPFSGGVPSDTSSTINSDEGRLDPADLMNASDDIAPSQRLN